MKIRFCLALPLGLSLLLAGPGCGSGANVPIVEAPAFTPPANPAPQSVPKPAQKNGSPKNYNPAANS